MSAPPGMAELAGVVNSFRRDLGDPEHPKFLVLRCHPSVAAELAKDGGASYIPRMRPEPGHGVSYRQVGIDVAGGLPAGVWQLLEDGEIVGSGVVG